METLEMLLEKKEKNIEFHMFERRAMFLLNRPAEAVPTLKNVLQIKNDDDYALLALLLRIHGCEPSKENCNQAF